MDKKKKLVVANWKMNPLTSAEAVKIFDEIKGGAGKFSLAQALICPPALFIEALKKRASGGRVRLGAQNSSNIKGTGSHTGEISPEQLSALGVSHVIVGHSERRALGETNELINEKLSTALKAGLTVILCIGENSRDQDGEYLREIAKELVIGLRKIQRRYLLNLIIAYEPLWAISTAGSGPASPDDAREMAIFIRKVMSEVAGPDIAHSIPILYGGSVGPSSAADFVLTGSMDGLLVGRESLKPKHFLQIMEKVHVATKKNQ